MLQASFVFGVRMTQRETVAAALRAHARAFPDGFRPGQHDPNYECPWGMDEVGWDGFADAVLAALSIPEPAAEVRVWAVFETHKETGRVSFYGLFWSEDEARKDYGTPFAPYDVQFFPCNIYGNKPVEGSEGRAVIEAARAVLSPGPTAPMQQLRDALAAYDAVQGETT